MRVLVTGTSGHLGEALAMALAEAGHEVAGLDVLQGRCTNRVGSVIDRDFVSHCMRGVQCVFHAATLHKPHLATHTRQQFIDTNVTGTLNLLEEAVRAGVRAFIYTSTTSVFGDALRPPAGAPAVWVTEELTPVPKNIYGATKLAAEDLCRIFARNEGLPCVVLRTSRFFPEVDDDASLRDAYDDENLKVNELLYRRVDIEDVVSAHLLASEWAVRRGKGYARFVISASSPFTPADLAALRSDAPSAVRRLVPEYEDLFARRRWRMLPSIDRVYVNDRARTELNWRPKHDFATVIRRLRSGGPARSALARTIGSKGYHGELFADGPYPVAVAERAGGSGQPNRY